MKKDRTLKNEYETDLNYIARINLIRFIENYMNSKHISQEDMAQYVFYLSPQKLSNKLNGQVEMSFSDIEFFSKTLGVSTDDILGNNKSLDAVALNIKNMISKLTPEQRINALQILNLFCDSIIS